MSTYQVISSDDQQFAVPIEYSSNSQYFKAMEEYRQLNDSPSTNTPIEVEFTIQELNLIKIPITHMSPLQAYQAYPVDQFFLHEDRIHQLEVTIVRYSSEGTYINIKEVNSQDLNLLLTSFVFKNMTCAAMAVTYSNNFNRNDLIENEPKTEYWSRSQQYQYWRSVIQQYLEYLPINQVPPLPHRYTFDQCLAYLRRCDTIPATTNTYSEFNHAIEYLNFIDRGVISDSDCYIDNAPARLLKYLKFEDLSNPAIDVLYRRLIIKVDRRESAQSYRRVLNRFKMLELEQYSLEDDRYHIDDYPYTILGNTDSRVIQAVITVLGEYGIMPFNSKLFHRSLHCVSPAAVKLLDIDHQLVMTSTSCMDTFLSLDNHRITGQNQAQVKIAWHCILNGLDVIDDVDWYLRYICRERCCDVTDIIDHPDKASLIPCVLYYQSHQQHRHVIHIVAELGGRVALRDLDEGMILSMDTLNFALLYGYVVNDNDLDTIRKLVTLSHQDPLVIERLAKMYGIELVMDNQVVKIDEVINHVLLSEWMRLMPANITIKTWNSLTSEVDNYWNGKITLAEAITKIEGLINASLWNSIESVVNGIINYVRLNLTTDEEDAELDQFEARMIPNVTPRESVIPDLPNIPGLPSIAREHVTMLSNVVTEIAGNDDRARQFFNPDSLSGLMEAIVSAVGGSLQSPAQPSTQPPAQPTDESNAEGDM